MDEQTLQLLQNQNGPIPVKFVWGPEDGNNVAIQGLSPIINFNNNNYMAYKIQDNALLYTWVLDSEDVTHLEQRQDESDVLQSSGQQETK